MYKYLLTIAVSSLLVLGACKKKDDGGGNNTTHPDVSGKSKREIFKMQDWRWADQLDSAENETVWVSEMDACNTDDIYTFKSGDVVTVNEGANDCLPTDPNIYNMVWSMTSDNANSVMLYNQPWGIISMTNTEIVLWGEYNSGTEHHYKKVIFKRP